MDYAKPTAYILASDLDGTLIPPHPEPDPAVAVFADLFGERRRSLLVYATGRHLELALDGIARTGLPAPDYLICDVGTTLYRPADAGWTPDPDYAQSVRRAFGDTDPLLLRRILESEFPGLTRQEESKQGAFKLSYYVQPDGAAGWVETLTEFLGRQGSRGTVDADCWMWCPRESPRPRPCAT